MNIQDVKSLRLTCKASNEILASQILHSITINISKSTMDKDLHKLQCLATRPCPSATSHATHQLTIKSLSPGYDPNRAFIRVADNNSSGFYTLNTEPQPSSEALLAEDEIKNILFDALSSFQNVRSVSYVIFHTVYHLFALTEKCYSVVDGNLPWMMELGSRPL
jgi:hypothetical protein